MNIFGLLIISWYELLIILSIIFAFMFLPLSILFTCKFFPLRKKEFAKLEPKQKQMVKEMFDRYKNTKKAKKKTPDMTTKEYTRHLAKQGKKFLIVSIAMPLYIIGAILLYVLLFNV